MSSNVIDLNSIVTPNEGPPTMEQDLARSGLVPMDVGARIIQNEERAVTRTPFSTQGYVFPYFDIAGKPVPFYRVRLFQSDPKYRQPKETPNHIYFPRGFREIADKKRYIMITEGEKKAAACVKAGFPTVGLGGVDSWRSRTIELPDDAEITGREHIKAKLPAGSEPKEKSMQPFAHGFQELVDYIISRDLFVIICYDSDAGFGTKAEVQRAAAALGFELRFRGIPFVRIRQLILPPMTMDENGKVALDDFIVDLGAQALANQLNAIFRRESAFPRHPSIQEYIAKKLQAPHLPRKDIQQISVAVLADMDSNGIRLINKSEQQHYYFNYGTHELSRADFAGLIKNGTPSPFSRYLYRQFGLSQADARVLVWLNAQFAGEEPIKEVTPYRVLARPQGDAVHYQINDGQYVTVSSEAAEGSPELPGIEVWDNGDNGILFEAEKVLPLRPSRLLEEYALQAARHDSYDMPFWWNDVLKDVRLKDQEQQRTITALLFYASPWLQRWRGTQLPVELVLGEAGSGKSTLCELRLNILTGMPKLRNAPSDLRDWTASVSNTGGMHVTDNLQMTDKQLRQRLSDELCRITTEPFPMIESRKLYTDNQLIQVPIHLVFGVTSIKQPFVNQDILQRSIVIELDKSLDIKDGDLHYDSEWMQRHLERFGGREAWVAHHLYVLHQFFKLVKQNWNPKYKAKHRLINFEQIIVTMGKVFHLDTSWIPDYLSDIVNRAVTDADWAFEGLAEFASQCRIGGAQGSLFSCGEIAAWAKDEEEYKGCDMLTNPRMLGRYMQQHKTQLHTVIGIMEHRFKQNNRAVYLVLPEKKKG